MKIIVIITVAMILNASNSVEASAILPRPVCLFDASGKNAKQISVFDKSQFNSRTRSNCDKLAAVRLFLSSNSLKEISVKACQSDYSDCIDVVMKTNYGNKYSIIRSFERNTYPNLTSDNLSGADLSRYGDIFSDEVRHKHDKFNAYRVDRSHETISRVVRCARGAVRPVCRIYTELFGGLVSLEYAMEPKNMASINRVEDFFSSALEYEKLD